MHEPPPSPPPAHARTHSLLAGIRGASRAAQYVLCLDDDVLLHRGLLAALVRDMEADATLFMATGECERGGGGDERQRGAAAAAVVLMRHSGERWAEGLECDSCHERHTHICILPVGAPPPICPPPLPPPPPPPPPPPRTHTGYPFDVPCEGAGVLSYCALSYHLPLIVPFSIKQRTQFVWGGCMLFRAEEMRGDARGILRVRRRRLRRRPARLPLASAALLVRASSSPSASEAALTHCTLCRPPARPFTAPPLRCPLWLLPDTVLPTALAGWLQAWGEGGYSDDLTVASQCTEQGLDIYCPGYSIFPQWSVSQLVGLALGWFAG